MKVAVIGKSGKIGRRVVCAIDQDANCSLISMEEADILIDFSHPDRTPALLDFAIREKKPLVMGTTGHDSLVAIEEAGKQIPLLFAPNFSLGMLMMRQMSALLSRVLGERATFDLIEVHHENKIDKPSGTALAIEKAMEQDLPIHSIRTKGSFGEHTLRVGMEGEQLAITHRALGRDLYAKMALESAKILLNKPPKLYSLEELFYADILRPVCH